MQNTISNADALMRQALALYRDEVRVRTLAFEQELAELRRKIQSLEDLLTPTSAEPIMPEAQRAAPAPSSNALPQSTRTDLSPQRWARRLHGMTQLEALMEIAEQYDGEVRTTDAKRILLEAKMIKGNPKNTLSHLHHLLRNSEQFVHIGPGAFRLVSPQDNTDEACATDPAPGDRLGLPAQVEPMQDDVQRSTELGPSPYLERPNSN